MADFYDIFGEAINESSINDIAINGILYVDYTQDVGGSAVASGSASVYAHYFTTPSGYVEASGYVTEAYAQLQIVGGYATATTYTIPAYWAHKYFAGGYATAFGEAVAVPTFMVQIMANSRTAYVLEEVRSADVLGYLTDVIIVSTEDREAQVPPEVDYYRGN